MKNEIKIPQSKNLAPEYRLETLNAMISQTQMKISQLQNNLAWMNEMRDNAINEILANIPDEEGADNE